jgi:hypothetical protein
MAVIKKIQGLEDMRHFFGNKIAAGFLCLPLFILILFIII